MSTYGGSTSRRPMRCNTSPDSHVGSFRTENGDFRVAPHRVLEPECYDGSLTIGLHLCHIKPACPFFTFEVDTCPFPFFTKIFLNQNQNFILILKRSSLPPASPQRSFSLRHPYACLRSFDSSSTLRRLLTPPLVTCDFRPT